MSPRRRISPRRPAEPSDQRSDLDPTDRRIIDFVCEHGHVGPRATARGLGLSERVVVGRLQRMAEQGVMRIHVVGDLPSFGYVFQAVARISVEPKETRRAARALAEIEEIIGLTGVLGDCDFVAFLVARTQDQLDASIEHRIAKIPGIVSIRLDLLLDIVAYQANVVMLEPGASALAAVSPRAEHTGGRFDETDIAIVGALREDATRSNREIARRFGLSEPTVRRRINRMTGARAIDVRPLVDLRALGSGYTGWAWIEVDYDRLRATAERLARIEGVDTVALVASGRSNVFAVLTREDAASCAGMIREQVLRTPGVHRVHVIQATDLLKQDLFWRRLL